MLSCDNWYAVFVKTGKEERVSESIREIAGRVLVPKRVMKERCRGMHRNTIRTLFPGYLFVQTDSMDGSKFTKIKRADNVIKPLFDPAQPKPIDPREMKPVLSLIDDNGVVNMSTAMYQNRQIKIIDGPLKGHEGLITKVDKHHNRVEVLVTIGQNTFKVSLGTEFIGI
ncbi:MAG TPA: antiterminator LoaP [Clostridia bacterium]|nr:antiterminator LoaP [Clostridia bacterium]